jgi:hypothetical protein
MKMSNVADVLKNFRQSIGVSLAMLALAGPNMAGAQESGSGVLVSIVADADLGLGARHGILKLKAALAETGAKVEEVASPRAAKGEIMIVAGLARGSGFAVTAIERLGATAPADLPESLLIHNGQWRDKQVLLAAGSDDRGLMYALLDVADRIGWAKDPRKPLSEVRDAREQPDIPERALSVYTMQRKWVESRFYDEAYWTRYLDMLAENRYNSFVFIMGYSPGTGVSEFFRR